MTQYADIFYFRRISVPEPEIPPLRYVCRPDVISFIGTEKVGGSAN